MERTVTGLQARNVGEENIAAEPRTFVQCHGIALVSVYRFNKSQLGDGAEQAASKNKEIDMSRVEM
jgi:hypothetical protein